MSAHDFAQFAVVTEALPGWWFKRNTTTRSCGQRPGIISAQERHRIPPEMVRVIAMRIVTPAFLWHASARRSPDVDLRQDRPKDGGWHDKRPGAGVQSGE